MALTLTSKLNAVNTMLSNIGEPPINALEGEIPADAVISKNLLDEISREVQSVGWHFNTERDVVLTPDSSNLITLSSNVVRVDLEPINSSSHDIVQRGSKLYDRKNLTFEFSSTLKAVVVYLLDWDDTPEPARRYITMRSARILSDRMIGDEKSHARRVTDLDEMRALAGLREFEMDTNDHNIFDHYDVYRVIDRRSIVDQVN